MGKREGSINPHFLSKRVQWLLASLSGRKRSLLSSAYWKEIHYKTELFDDLFFKWVRGEGQSVSIILISAENGFIQRLENDNILRSAKTRVSNGWVSTNGLSIVSQVKLRGENVRYCKKVVLSCERQRELTKFCIKESYNHLAAANKEWNDIAPPKIVIVFWSFQRMKVMEQSY